MIRHLPADVRACIRTGVALTSFAQAVEELVLNSIDAGASSIAVRVDLSCFKIQVVDNGAGISLDQFKLIGERYSTSKCHSGEDLENLKYFGYRGEALASLRTAASFLEIVSRSKYSTVTHCKCFQNGTVLDTSRAALPRPSVGTTVTAHDLFYSLPVRRKCLNEGLEVEKIRYRLAGIALMWPLISFTLRDDSVGHVILQTRKCSGMAASFSCIFTPARARGLMEVSAERDEFKISGLVSKESYSRMDLQFVFVNKRLVLKSSIHRQVNKILGRSQILRRKGLTSEALEKLSHVVVTSTGSPQKSSERYGIFVVNIDCPYSAYDITFDPSKTLVEFRDWPKLIHLLQDMFYGFLRRENLIYVPEPSSIASPECNDEDNDDDDDDDDDDFENASSFESGISSQDENVGKKNVSQGSVEIFQRNLSTVIENGLFSKSVHRPKKSDQERVQGSSEQSNSQAHRAREPETASSDQQLQNSTGAHSSLSMNQESSHKSKLGYGISTSAVTSCSPSELVPTDPCVLNVTVSRENYDAETRKALQAKEPDGLSIHQSPLSEELKSEGELVHTGLSSQSSKLNTYEDSEEVLVKSQARRIIERKEITLGNSVHYSSTLKGLREINPTSSSTSASEIITSTLQLLRQSTQKAMESVGDPYKTPGKSALGESGPSPNKRPKLDRGVVVAGGSSNLDDPRPVVDDSANSCRSKNKNTLCHDGGEDVSILKPKNQFGSENTVKSGNTVTFCTEPGSSVTFRSAKEDRTLGQNDREAVLKRTLCQRESQASKLAKLMRGEKVIEKSEETEDGEGSSKVEHSGILSAFRYTKSQRNNKFSSINKELESLSCVPNRLQRDFVQSSNKDSIADLLLQSSNFISDLESDQSKMDTAGVSGKDMQKVSHKMLSNDQTVCSGVQHSKCCCCQVVCQNRKHSGQVEDNLLFSAYRTAEGCVQDMNGEKKDSSLKSSVVLSLSLENVCRGGQFENTSETAKSVLLSDEDCGDSLDGHSMTVRRNADISKIATDCSQQTHDISKIATDCSQQTHDISKVATDCSQQTHDISKVATDCSQQTQGFVSVSSNDSEVKKVTECSIAENINSTEEFCVMNHDHSPSSFSSRTADHHFRSNASTPISSQGFTVTNEPSFEEGKNSPESSKNAGNEERVKSALEVSSNSYSPTYDDLSPDNKHFNIQSQDTKILLSKGQVSNGVMTDLLVVGLSDSDSDVYIRRSTDIELVINSSDILHGSLVSSARRGGANVETEGDMKDKESSPDSELFFCNGATTGKRDEIKDKKSTVKKSFNNPVIICEDVPHKESLTIEDPVKMDYSYQKDGGVFSRVPGTENSRLILEVVNDCVANTDMAQAATGQSPGSSGDAVLNRTFHEEEKKVSIMIADAEQVLKRMQKSLGVSISKQDLYTGSLDDERHHSAALWHKKRYEGLPGSAPERKAGSEVGRLGMCLENENMLYETNNPDVNPTYGSDTVRYTCQEESSWHIQQNSSNDSLPCGQVRSDYAVLQSVSEHIHSLKSGLCCQDAELRDSHENWSNWIPANNGQATGLECSHPSLCVANITENVSEGNVETGGAYDFVNVKKDVSHISKSILSAETKETICNKENELEFDEANTVRPISYTEKHRDVINTDAFVQTQLESKEADFSGSESTSSHAEQMSLMSSEGDNMLSMIEEPVKVRQTHEKENRDEEKCVISGPLYQGSDLMASDKFGCVEDGAKQRQSSVATQKGKTIIDGNPAGGEMDDSPGGAEIDDSLRGTKTSGTWSNIDGPVTGSSTGVVLGGSPKTFIGAISFDGVIAGNTATSSLSLLRSASSDKTCDIPGRHFKAGDITPGNADPAHETECSHTDQNTMPVIQDLSDPERDMSASCKNLNNHIEESNPSEGDQHHKTLSLRNEQASKSHEEQLKMACWKEVVDCETGKKTFINNLSGHTVSEKQWTQMSSQTQREMLAIPTETVKVSPAGGPASLSVSEKQAFDDMISDHLEQEENEAVSKWRGGRRPVCDKQAEADISALMSKWTNPVFLNYKQPGLLADMCPSGTVARSCFHSLSSVEFTKDMLETVKVIGQLDNKFIACLIEKPQNFPKAVNSRNSTLLVLFDQHAVHERVRLERLTKDSYELENGERTDRIKRSEVRPAQSVTINQDDLRILKAFRQEFHRIGVSLSFDNSSRNTVYINSAPSCMVEKDTGDLKKNKPAAVIESVENLIKEHIDLLKSTNGACGRLPLAIHRTLCSQACHGAVKFGDKLTFQECRELLSSLTSCSLPFQCAHGRPSVAPLVSLTALEKELLSARRQPSLWKISQHINK